MINSLTRLVCTFCTFQRDLLLPANMVTYLDEVQRGKIWCDKPECVAKAKELGWRNWE